MGRKVKLLLVGNSFAALGAEPRSALGRMGAGRKPRSGRRCGCKRVGFVVTRGVRVDMNFGK
jgi:hypothetical protein